MRALLPKVMHAYAHSAEQLPRRRPIGLEADPEMLPPQTRRAFHITPSSGLYYSIFRRHRPRWSKSRPWRHGERPVASDETEASPAIQIA